jgi:hypothetical protein
MRNEANLIDENHDLGRVARPWDRPGDRTDHRSAAWAVGPAALLNTPSDAKT